MANYSSIIFGCFFVLTLSSCAFTDSNRGDKDCTVPFLKTDLSQHNWMGREGAENWIMTTTKGQPASVVVQGLMNNLQKAYLADWAVLKVGSAVTSSSIAYKMKIYNDTVFVEQLSPAAASAANIEPMQYSLITGTC